MIRTPLRVANGRYSCDPNENVTHQKLLSQSITNRRSKVVTRKFIAFGNQRGSSDNTTQGVRAGNLIFVGGQMSLDENGEVVGSDITTQARNAFEPIKRVLAEAGATMADVVKHNVYFHCDGDDAEVAKFIADLDQVRLTYFSDPGPTTTETRFGLGRKGALILVDAWAVVGAEKTRLMPAGHWNWNKQLPFSHGWKVGNMIFVGGQRSLDQDGRLVGAGDIEVQTDNAFRNLDAMLKEGGGNQSHLMRQNTYYRFSGEGPEVTGFWEKMTRVRQRYMSVPSAAGAGIRMSGFPLSEELIQVEGIAILGEERKQLNPDNHWDWSIPNSQFSQGWQVGNLTFVGGQISADNKAHAVGKDLATQTHNVFKFIRSILRKAGLDESDVVKLYIYFYAGDDWADIAEASATIADIQREFYPEPGPASTVVRASGFAFEDLLIEIEAMAVRRN
jgi:enamine deaminase RidA (YjgF/YER057c/UK114 family)